MSQFRQTLGRLLCAVIVLLSINASAQLKVNGRYLYDQCNEKIVLRGVNEMFIYSSDREGVTTYPEIAMTGANAVRFMWRTDTAVQFSAFENNIKNCVANKMIPIPGLWDATGKWGADFEKCVSWWLNPEVVAICQRNPYMILNIANEAGGSAMADYTAVYTNAIQRLRSAGITNVIMVDADRWGRNWTAIRDKGASLLAADPQKNIMFSWHPWDTNIDYATPINTIVGLNLCFVVGEFSYKSVGCTCCIDYKQIMATAQTQQVGTLAWSWGLVKNADCTDGAMDMSTNATFAGLKSGWPLEMATTDPYSIKNTSIRPYSIRNGGACGPATIPVSGITVSPTSSSIAPNTTVTLIARVSPNNATNRNLIWSSNNPTVATVSSTGVVTGKSAGNATISVTTQEGGKTATSLISVAIGTTLTVNDATKGTGTNQFEYVGTWPISTGIAKYSGDDHYSSTTNAYFNLRFNGTKVSITGAKAPHHGRFAISIDGGAEVLVDCYSSTRTEQVVLWTSGTLTNGPHILKGRVAGTRNASSTGNGVSIDKADITTAATSTTSTLLASADTDTQSDPNGTNVSVNPSQSNRAFFRFNLTGIQTVTSAKLRLYKSTTSTGTLNVNNADDNWVEGPTNPTKPVMGAFVASGTMGATVGYIEVDVTNRVAQEAAGDDLITFGITTSLGSWTGISTRENAANNPQLVITHTGTIANTAASSTLSLEEEQTSTISVSPNPASDYVNVEFTADKSQNVKYQVLNLMSQQVLAGEKLVGAGSNALSINVSSLQHGVYLLRIEKDGKSSVMKLIVE